MMLVIRNKSKVSINPKFLFPVINFAHTHLCGKYSTRDNTDLLTNIDKKIDSGVFNQERKEGGRDFLATTVHGRVLRDS